MAVRVANKEKSVGSTRGLVTLRELHDLHRLDIRAALVALAVLAMDRQTALLRKSLGVRPLREGEFAPCLRESAPVAEPVEFLGARKRQALEDHAIGERGRELSVALIFTDDGPKLHWPTRPPPSSHPRSCRTRPWS